MSKLSFDEQKPNGFKVPSVYTFIPLESKRAVMDLTNADLLQETPRYSGDLGDVDNWDELQASFSENITLTTKVDLFLD